MSPITFTLFIFLLTLIKNIGAPSPFPDAVVSLWRLDAAGKKPEAFLSVGAMIKPNCIFILRKLFGVFQPFNTIGFYTGRSFRDSRRMEDSAIVDALHVPGHKSFSFLVVKPSIYVEMTFEIVHNHYISGQIVKNDCGYFIGWNIQYGSTIKEVNFKRQVRFKLHVENSRDISEYDFPASSFIVKGIDIVAVSYSITPSFKMYNFTQVSMSLTAQLRNLFEDVNSLRITDADPFPEAVVSFWRLDEEGQPQELLYVAALIQSNLILVPRDALLILSPFHNLGLYTKQKCAAELPTPLIPVRYTIVDAKEIPGTNRFIILVMNPGIRLPNPYIVSSTDTCSKISHNGHFIGWERTDEAVKKEATLIDFQENLHLVFKNNSHSFENFPLGSFLVTRDKNIKAIFHSIDGDGEPAFLVFSNNDSESIRIFLERENNLNFV